MFLQKYDTRYKLHNILSEHVYTISAHLFNVESLVRPYIESTYFHSGNKWVQPYICGLSQILGQSYLFEVVLTLGTHFTSE